MKKDKFDYIKNDSTNDSMIIIFENKFKKNNVKLNIEDDIMKIEYPDGKVEFKNEDKECLHEITTSRNIYIIEIDRENNRSKGHAIHSYPATIG